MPASVVPQFETMSHLHLSRERPCSHRPKRPRDLKQLGKLIVKFWTALLALVCITAMPMTDASAITVEVAKKCQALTAKAYPPRVVGNPAAGSAKGTGQSERDYFNKCVTNGGRI
jgi:hypothetical protein